MVLLNPQCFWKKSWVSNSGLTLYSDYVCYIYIADKAGNSHIEPAKAISGQLNHAIKNTNALSKDADHFFFFLISVCLSNLQLEKHRGTWRHINDLKWNSKWLIVSSSSLKSASCRQYPGEICPRKKSV